MVPEGANAMLTFGVPGRLVYTTVLGVAVSWPEMRHIAGLSAPAPVHESSVNRSPLSGSTESAVGQVRSDATVWSMAPLAGSILKTAPVVKLPVVALRLANRLPLWSKTNPAK